MPKRSGSAKQQRRARHGTRKWIMQALESAKGSVAMRTSEIQKKASQLRGSEIPGYSVYQALRTLVKREVVAAKREGREFTYRLKSKANRTPSVAAAAPAATPMVTPEAAPMIAPSTAPAPPAAVSTPIVHTLAPGEVAILHVGEKHVETASNVHGQLVLAKHRRPA